MLGFGRNKFSIQIANKSFTDMCEKSNSKLTLDKSLEYGRGKNIIQIANENIVSL